MVGWLVECLNCLLRKPLDTTREWHYGVLCIAAIYVWHASIKFYSVIYSFTEYSKYSSYNNIQFFCIIYSFSINQINQSLNQFTVLQLFISGLIDSKCSVVEDCWFTVDFVKDVFIFVWGKCDPYFYAPTHINSSKLVYMCNVCDPFVSCVHF